MSNLFCSVIRIFLHILRPHDILIRQIEKMPLARGAFSFSNYVYDLRELFAPEDKSATTAMTSTTICQRSHDPAYQF